MPRDLRDWSPSLLKIVAEATTIPEVVVLHDPSPEELEACTLDGRLAVLAIVPGRAALVSTALRSRFRPVVHEGDKVTIRPPHEVLAELDQSLRDADLAESPTAAMCYAVLDLESRKLSIANAGHPLPVRLRASGTA